MEAVRGISLRELREQVKNDNGHSSFRVTLFHSWWDWAKEEARPQFNQMKKQSNPHFPISSLSQETAILSRTCASTTHPSAHPSALGGSPKLSGSLVSCELMRHKSRKIIIVC